MASIKEFVGLREAAGLVGVASWRLVYSLTAGHVPEVPLLAGRRVFNEADIDRLRKHFGMIQRSQSEGFK